jgi:hypothetical protein
MRAKTAVVLGAQWGDEGKGKIVDVLSERFSAVARYAGGHNAGHTVIIGEHKFVLQLIPCGVLRPGCKGVIGNGVVLDPIAFLSEVGRIRELGVQVDGNLFVSNRAQVILPYHRMIELAAESAPGRKKIGTTSRGIGPAYEDKMARSGLRVVDLLHTALLKTHIEAACAEKNAIAHALFGTDPLDPEKMYEEYAAAAEKVRPFVTDTGRLLNGILAKGGSVMFEGAQGTMLDIDHGTYPFVTSSSATAGGAATGTGVGPTAIGTVDFCHQGLRHARRRRPVPHRNSRRSRRSAARSAATSTAPSPGVPGAAAGSIFRCCAIPTRSTERSGSWSPNSTFSMSSKRFPFASDTRSTVRSPTKFPRMFTGWRRSSRVTPRLKAGVSPLRASPSSTRCRKPPRSTSPSRNARAGRR